MGEFSKKKTTKNADGALSETFTNSAEQGVISQLDYFDHDITNDANISGYYVVQPDDFVYNPRISATAPCGPINRNRLNRAGVMSPLYTVFSADSSVDKTYLEHYFKTSRWHAFMFLEGNSGARSDRFSISDATFFEMPIWCPEISEQMAIAKQLETADSLITLHQRKCQYRGLYGYLSWEQRKLGEVAHRVIRKNEGNQSDLPLTISAQHGLVDQRDYFNNQVASRDMSGYYLLENGEFAYNKSTSGDSPWGAIKRLTKYEKGCLSTLYICFGLDLGDPDFLVTYYETNRWHGAVQMIAAEGARNHGLLNIAPDDFFETVLTLPCSTEEQKQIGCFFTQLNSLITLHQREPRFADTG